MFKMGREKRGTLALEAWARQLTTGYPNVSVDNMTTSWRNGLAFCALIHRFRPDLIDYDKLEPSDILGNCSLAFETAESKLGIPALLDPEDMAAHEVPDRLSVLTYVAQFYSLFKNAEKKSTVPLMSSATRRQKDEVDLKTRSTDKSTTPNSEKVTPPSSPFSLRVRRSPTNPSSRSTSPTAPTSVSAVKRRFELNANGGGEDNAKRSALLAPPPCSKCENPVYISERTVFMKKLYHRKCFRCHGCASMLNPHTADISSDGNSFFCLAKQCQLELLRVNRQASGGGVAPFISNSTSAIKDPSLLVRTSSSRVAVSNKSETENGFHNSNNVSNSSSPSPSHLLESKENYVPVPSVTDSNVGGEETVGGGRVSRLTARFECVQEDDHSKEKQSISNSLVCDDDNKSSSGGAETKREISHQSSSITSTNVCDDVEMPPVLDKHDQKNDLSAVPQDKDTAASPLIRARSHWLQDQIQKEEEKKVLVEEQDLHVSSSDISIGIPTVIVSSEENNGNNKNISIEFKLGDDDNNSKPLEKAEEMEIEENVGDSGISGISSIDNGGATTTTKTEDEDKNKFVNTMVVSREEGDTTTENHYEEPPVPAADNENMEEDSKETVTLTSEEKSSSSAIKEEEEDTVVEEKEPLQVPQSTLSDLENSNPFEEDEEEKERDLKPESEPVTDPDHQLQEQNPVAENNATIPTPNESPEPEPSPSETGAPSPQHTTTERVTPSPRKKKRAPQPSPLLQSPSKQEPGRPMPSPRTRSKFGNSVRSPSKMEEYPVELNPFGDDDPVPPQPSPRAKPRPKSSIPAATTVAPSNPFEDDEDDSTLSIVASNDTTQESVNLSRNSSSSALKNLEVNNNGNANGSGAQSQPTPTPRSSTPKVYNPFEDEEEEDIGDYDGDDKPTGIFARGSHDDTSSISSKTSDLSNTSGLGCHHKSSIHSGDISSLSGSTKLRSRKSRRAPLPPGLAPPSAGGSNVPHNEPLHVQTASNGHPSPSPSSSLAAPPSPKKIIPVSPELKVIKNKSPYKKKRRAPPPRRRVEPLPEDQIKTELGDLEIKQKELERQGISLENNIRQMMSQDDEGGEENLDSNGSDQLDEMIIQLWGIVNEKNDILRRQTELEYLRRSHRLEEMQAELEFQLRIFMDTPEDLKAENHATSEQLLLDELLKLVDERNEVVDWLDYYRQMDREEEMHVSKSITAFKSQNSSGLVEMVSQLKLKSKKKKEEKEKAKLAKSSKEDLHDTASTSSGGKGKKKDGKLGLFGTFRKKSKNKRGSTTKIDEDKDIDESVVTK